MNRNFDNRLQEDRYLKNVYSFIDSITNRLKMDYMNTGFEIYNQMDGRFSGYIVFRKSIGHTSSDHKVTYYDYIKFIMIDYHISFEGVVDFIINKTDKSPIKELGKLKLGVDNTISNSDYRKLTNYVNKGVYMNTNFSERLRKCFSSSSDKYVIKVTPNPKYLSWQIDFKDPGYLQYTSSKLTAFRLVSDKEVATKFSKSLALSKINILTENYSSNIFSIEKV